MQGHGVGLFDSRRAWDCAFWNIPPVAVPPANTRKISRARGLCSHLSPPFTHHVPLGNVT